MDGHYTLVAMKVAGRGNWYTTKQAMPTRIYVLDEPLIRHLHSKVIKLRIYLLIAILRLFTAHLLTCIAPKSLLVRQLYVHRESTYRAIAGEG